MQANNDLTELLALLNAEGAEYVIVGAYALALHGRARATKDVDIFIRSTAENAQRVWRALVAFGAPLSNLKVGDLASQNTFFIMGRPPNQIDIVTSIDAVSFEQAWATRVATRYGGVPVSFIGKAELIANKKATGRLQDLADVESLERS